jgi:hypothetical protein
MTPEQKEVRRARHQWRYDNDPEYRKRLLDQQREYRKSPAYREKTLLRKREWASRNREHLRQKRREWYRTEMAKPVNRRSASVRTREYRLRQMGATPEAIQQRRDEQGGGCAICRRHKRLLIDHNHTTGAFRALLCSSCNTALGLLQDSPEILQEAIAYLNRWDTPEENR